MKKFFSVILCVTCALTLSAQTPDGLTCETAIPVDKSYQGSIDAPGVYYYTAWTYDLPLTCYFYPISEVDSLYLDIDFTCTPGVYDDPNIQELLDETMGWGVKVPMRFDNFIKEVDEYGRLRYSLSVSQVYRDLMGNFGISYDVKAFVKVKTTAAGEIRMEPDLAFRTCVESSKWLNLPDTISVSMLSADDTYVLPLSDWQNDSIRFIWKGQNAPIQMWIAEDCDFELKLTGENAALKCYEIRPDAGNSENIFVMTRQDIVDLIDFANNGGVLYMRAITSEDAELIVEKQPIQGPMADAIRLEFNKPASVQANNVQQVYYFPATWKQRDLLLSSEKNTAITAYFYGDVNLTQPLCAYDFSMINNETYLGISVKELSDLLKNYKEEYVFVVFNAKQNTTITPAKWEVCPCVQTTSRVDLGDTVALKARTTISYRVDYNTWCKNNVTIKWSAKNKMKLAVADTCAGFTLADTDPHVLQYKLYENSSSKQLDSIVIAGETIRTWANRVDENGFLYLRCNANIAGSLIISYEPDPTVQPEEPTSPCVANSIELKANDQLTLNLDSAFTVYRINYNEWVATGATLTWTSLEPLHTFVAETCEFAVAPYNKYVHAYVSVPAEGVAVLDAAKLAEMAAYVDEDGYLYIRFLTEKEGVLTVK
jgi:hypothetical protein